MSGDEIIPAGGCAPAVVVPACEGCANRAGILYIAKCARCAARMLARTPRTILRASGAWRDADEATRALILEERAADDALRAPV